MPRFTIEDVDRDIEERRARYRQPKPDLKSPALERLKEEARKRKGVLR